MHNHFVKNHAEIYWLKAIAICTVVLIHALTYREIFPAQGTLAEFLSHATRFAVPFFLFSTGFLIDKTSLPGPVLARKLFVRIGLPYLTASAFFLTVRSNTAVLDGRIFPDIPTVLHALAFGEALGIYYYIFVIAYLCLLSLFLRRLGVIAIHLLFLFALALQIDFILQGSSFPAVEPSEFFWVVARHPAMHLPYFLAGWQFSVHYKPLKAWITKYAKRIIFICLPLDVFLLVGSLGRHDFFLQQLLEQLHIVTVLVLVLACTLHMPRAPRPICFLADASYAIYLFHLPLVRIAQSAFDNPTIPVAARIGIAWAIGLAGTIALVLALQRLFGGTSRRWFGA